MSPFSPCPTTCSTPARQLQGGRLFPGQPLYTHRPAENAATSKELKCLSDAELAELDELIYDGLTEDYQGDRMPAGARGSRAV